MATVWVSGGFGFLGRAVVERLTTRGHDVVLLSRGPVSPARQAWLDGRPAARVRVVSADVTDPTLGGVSLDGADVFIHAAAVYDLDADPELLQRTNVDGTRHVLDAIRRATRPPRLLHVSSVAVAGDHAGPFGEEDLDVGQGHPTAYHRTKFEAERLVREATDLDVRIVRPSAIVGDSRTGAADRHDGPYVLFSAVKTLRHALPGWMPLVGFTPGTLDMVPVDFVADAIVHLALTDAVSGRGFHLGDPHPPTFQDAFNALSRAAGGPVITRRVGGKGGVAKLFPGVGDMVGQLGAVKNLRRAALEGLGVPDVFDRAKNFDVRFDTTNIDAALVGTGVACPRLDTYAGALWDHWVRHLDPDRTPELRRRRGLAGKRVLITGASSGVGEALAKLCAANGAEVVVVARREDELARVVAEITTAGGRAVARPCDLTDLDACDVLIHDVLTTVGPIDVLVNNAARSIRRTIPETYARPHDYERVMRLNYHAPVRLCLGVLPSMVERGSGHVVSVLTAGTHMPMPRFAAYGASKAALSAFTDTLSAEFLHEGVHATNVYLGWVKTPMMTATEKYKDMAESRQGVMTPDEAAAWILDGIVAKKRHIKDATTTRRYVWNQVAPSFMTRALSYVYRIYHDQPDRFPELTVDRALFKRFFKHDLV